MARSTTVERRTKETDISIILNLDGTGKVKSIQASDFLIICWKVLQNTVFLT